jgi:pyrroline-5-carboxylate reductase
MSKSVRKRSAAPYAAGGAATALQKGTVDPRSKKPERGSKQSRVIAMLQSPAGTTIAAMMEATGWQQRSVRGFLAGVVRKRLKLKLGSKKVDGTRVYRIASGDSGKPGARRSKRQSS